MKLIMLILVAQCTLLFVSCTTKKQTQFMPMPKEQLLSITKEYLVSHHPAWTKSLNLPAAFSDHGDYWEVTFELPEGTLGGTPVVQIRKQTYEVIKAYHTQ